MAHSFCIDFVIAGNHAYRHHPGMNSPDDPLHESLGRLRPARRERQLEQFIAARRAAESAITLAMITSYLPGMEVHFFEPEVIELPPGVLGTS
jgi:hypothetical protein